jgi:peptidoglycan/LPS O-acetylase OafA/YrhL
MSSQVIGRFLTETESFNAVSRKAMMDLLAVLRISLPEQRGASLKRAKTSEKEIRLKRVEQLDGIRGLAIAISLAVHSAPLFVAGVVITRTIYAVNCLIMTGWLGVDIFFVLSGYLITGIILEDRTKPDFWTTFYTRRGFRILPAFAAVFIAAILAAYFFFPEIPLSARFLLPPIFFLGNWTVLTNTEFPLLPQIWSLAIEEQFYFLWPQAAKRLSPVAIFKLAISLVIVCELSRIGLAMIHFDSWALYKITPTRIDGLAIGATLAAGMTLPAVHRFLASYWRRIALLAACVLTVAFVLLPGHLTPHLPSSQIVAIPAAVVLTAMLIYGSIESSLPNLLYQFFTNPVMTYLGRRSYALYLIQFPIAIEVRESRVHGYLAELQSGVVINILLILSVLAASLILAEISWRLIEAPAQSLRRLWMRNRPVHIEVAAERH